MADKTFGSTYTEGDVDASIGGMAILMEAAGNTLVPLPGDTSGLIVQSPTAANMLVRASGAVAHDGVGTGTNPNLIAFGASAAAPADVSADGDVVRAWALRNGALATALTAAGALIGGDATNGLDVDVTRLPYDVAHDGVDSGNPLKIGAQARNALPAAVANADRTNIIADLFGRQLIAFIDPAQALHANKTFTGAQTGADVITPSGGKKLAITSVVVGSYGTTTGRMILWFGDNADTFFTQDTDQVLAAASFAPSTNSKPGLVYAPPTPVFCTVADRELHITTDAAISLDVTIEYYEF